METYEKLNGFRYEKKVKVAEKSSTKIKRVLEKGEFSEPRKKKRKKAKKHNGKCFHCDVQVIYLPEHMMILSPSEGLIFLLKYWSSPPPTSQSRFCLNFVIIGLLDVVFRYSIALQWRKTDLLIPLLSLTEVDNFLIFFDRRYSRAS